MLEHYIIGLVLGFNITIWSINASLFYRDWKRDKQEINGVVTWITRNGKYEYTRKRLKNARRN